MADFPDVPGVAKLRGEHIYTVVLIHHIVEGLPPNLFATPDPPFPSHAARKSIKGIRGVTEEQRGDVTIFHISHR
jgi:hypothetical protein